MVEDERAAFSRATALHREGRFDEALDIYGRLLKARPGVFEVERLVVFAHLQAGRIKDAHAAARRAKQNHSNNPHAHVLLGATLQAEHKWERALRAFEAAARLDPGLVEARYLAGNMLANLGRHAEALAAFDMALALDPRAVEALANRAQVRVRLGQSAEALADFTRLAELQPWEPAHFLARGALLLELGRGAEAGQAALAALQLKPDLADAHFLVGQTLRAEGDLPAARNAFRIALAAAPDRSAFQAALAGIERELGDAEMPSPLSAPPGAPAAAPDAGTAETGPEPAEALHAHGDPGTIDVPGDFGASQAATAVAEAAEPPPARPLVAEPSAFDPRAPDAVEVVAERHQPPDEIPPGAGPFPVAEAVPPEQPSSLPPGEVCLGSLAPEALRRHAFDALAEGRWQDGWAGLEASATEDASAQQPLPLPFWDGQEKPSALIVTAEGDLADLILFGRLLRLLADRKSPARLLAQAEHVPLLSRIDARIPVASDLAGVNVRDAGLRWTPLASLPRLMAPDPRDWPQPPYLLADPARIARWRDMWPEGFAVGLAWNGDLALLSAFAALATVEGIVLVSLETRPEAEAELAATGFGGQVARLGPGWDEDGTLVDTAALIQHLDLVVTGEGPVAHLAGARGRPGLVAVGPGAHWCWGRDAGTSLFYPSLALVRAERRDDWSDVAASLAASVASRVATGRDTPR